jgi:DNA-binding CsgD family transcriptional regulator/PAS domain-containing protein
MILNVLQRLSGQIDGFLSRWTENMDKAGYLASTTAKREDCILSFRWFLEPILLACEDKQADRFSFGELIENEGDWAEKIVQTARRHRARGITGDMFLGCFKTLVHAILDMIDDGDEALDQKVATRRFIRLWADAFETIVFRDWTTLSQREADDSLDLANRQLTLEKCKYENVIDAISDLVFVLDAQGIVQEANRSARRYFQEEPAGTPVWELLKLEGTNIQEVLRRYPQNKPREVSFDDALYFHCVFTSLNEVSLSSDGYLAILMDISSHVKQREILETTVAERTIALQKEKAQLQNMNVTLRTVMKAIDRERESFQDGVAELVRSTLLPALETVRKERSEQLRSAYLDIVENQLLKLNRDGRYDRQGLLLKLTPMQMKVCQFIQAGASTKEIAEALNLSLVTIQTHRRNIRHKLGLQNRNINLYTFLNHPN